MAYGATGVLYFCYWSPAGQGGFAQGGGVMYPMGNTPKDFNKSSGKIIRDISLTSGKRIGLAFPMALSQTVLLLSIFLLATIW
jgi:hypothetical protein